MINKELMQRRAQYEFSGKEKELYDDLLKHIKDYDDLGKEGQENVEEIISVLISVLTLPLDEFRVYAPFFLTQVANSFTDTKLRYLVSSRMEPQDVDGISAAILSLNDSIAELAEKEGIDLEEEKRDFILRLGALYINFLTEVVGEKDNVVLLMQVGNKDVSADDVVVPNYAHTSDSGMDLYSTEEYDIAPGETVAVHTGIHFSIPEGYEIQIRNKSGIAKKTKLRVANQVGTIDSGYQGEIIVLLENIASPVKTLEVSSEGLVTNIEYNPSFHIDKNQKVAQAVLCKVSQATLMQVDSVNGNVETSRGDGGFGSTGV